MADQSKKTENEIGRIKPKSITEEMKESYIDYAMSVIISRALPDVRDGLKPVQRRILYAMHDLGLSYGSKYKKSATVVGEVLGKYHPHGDSSVYDAMARMAQDFSLRYPLVNGQGNWGSLDGDPQAAMRYTEARLAKISETLTTNIGKNTVDFIDNYDGSKKEPSVFPARLPQMLLNGGLGIAVGMATNIPPHNLSEVCDAAIHLLENPKASTEELFAFIKGPDFPTGGIVYNQREIINAYSQGKGPMVIRGKAEIVEREKGGDQILITEIPYQLQKSSLIEEFAKLVQTKRIDGIKDIRDESGKDVRIVIDLHRGVFPQKTLNRLYKFTNFQKTFHLNMIALVDGIQPQVLSLSQVLNHFIAHRKIVVFRKTEFELKRAEERAHILEGLHKALGKIDQVIKIIRASKDRQSAHDELIKQLKLTSIQANAILETKLHTLAKLERKKIEEELQEKRKEIKELTAILGSPKKIRNIIKLDLETLKKDYGDARRTKILVQKIGEIAEEDLIPQEETIVTLTKGGYIKRINPSVYKIQKRGGKGILGMKTRGEDIVDYFIPALTHDDLLFFTDSGKVFRTKVYEIPEESRVAKGRGLMNFLEISSHEKVLSVMSLNKEDKELGIKYLVMVTKNGIIKKTAIKEFDNIRRSGLIAINLKPGDLLERVLKSTGDDNIILTTSGGQSIRFKEKEVRPMGRSSSGVKGIRLKKEDQIIGAGVINAEAAKDKNKGHLLVVTENGFGKRTLLSQFKAQSRGGVGIKSAKITQRTGKLVSAKILGEKEEEIIAISRHGQVIKAQIKTISVLNRATQGVKIMRLNDDDKVASVVCV